MLKTVVGKLWLIIISLIILFVVAVFLINHRYNSQLIKLSEGESERVWITLNNILSLHTKSLTSFVYDYTYWDEMVNFTKNPSKRWAEVNIDAVLPQFKANCAWVFDTTFHCFYSYNVYNNKNYEKFFIDSLTLQGIFQNNKFPHFYLIVDNKIAEISGAPIQYSDDLEREGKPNGYFIAVRFYDEQFIQNLSETNSSKISIISVNEYNRIKNNSLVKNPEEISIFVPFRNYNNQVIGFLYSYHISEGIKLMRNSSRQHILILIFSGVMTLLILSFSLITFVIKPLKIISESLSKEDLLKLLLLSKRHSEFGKIASILLNFFNQKKLLENEIKLRRKTEVELLKLSSVVKQNPLGIIITDVNGIIEYINPRFIEITGYDISTLMGKKIQSLELENINKQFFSELLIHLQNNNIWLGEVLTKKRNGDDFWCSILAFALRDENRINNFIGIIDDITEKKKMYQELIEAKQKAEEINKIKSQFFAYMSHELRTPFMGLMGYADLIRETSDNPEIKEMAEGILRSSKRMVETLTNILDITKLEFDQTEVNIKPIVITNILEEVCNSFISAAETKGLKLIKSFNLDHEIINTDSKIFTGILNNLINNAIKFTNDGFIEVGAKIENNNLILNVRDSGIGIPMDKLSIIFQEFRQVSEGYTREYQGTGLGLAIVNKYVNLLGGKIQVESELGKGSNFIISIPVVIN